MRIVGGSYRGRKIAVSKGFNSRPTTDFARVALFNILNNYTDFESVKVLDLFCGTGSISFEFASRGCHDIDLVDINGHALDFIRKTADTLGMKGLNMVRMNAFRFIPVCRKQYDIVFADPPYELENIEQIPDLVLDHQLLLPGGLLILEHGKSNNFSKHTRFSEERTYGSVHFTFFK